MTEFIVELVKLKEEKLKILLAFAIVAIVLSGTAVGFSILTEPHQYNYYIDIDQEHGVIINNDTIQLEQLEEYIIEDNI